MRLLVRTGLTFGQSAGALPAPAIRGRSYCGINQGYPVNLTPLSKRLSGSANLNEDGASPVSGLFFAGRPSAIVWSVVSIIVYALNAHALRPFAHIRNKRLEVTPSFADANASPAIVFELFVPWVIASLSNIKPSIVKRVTAIRAAVSRLCLFCGDISVTSAGTSAALAKAGCSRRGFVAAVADALPVEIAAFFVRNANYSEHSETLSGEIIYHAGDSVMNNRQYYTSCKEV